MPLWQTPPDQAPGWLDRVARLVGLALVVLAGLTVALLEYVGAVFWLKGRNERDLASQGIVMGGDALNQAVLPALWLTLALVALQVLGVVLLVCRHRRRAVLWLDQS